MNDKINRSLCPPPTVLAVFGATGDLTRRKLIPAICNLAVDGYLPEKFAVVGASRRPFSDDAFRELLYESLNKHSRREITKECWEDFSKKIFYQKVEFGNQEDFRDLKKRLQEIEKSFSENPHCLYYLATRPGLFSSVAEHLKAAGLVEDENSKKRTSVIVEKPFGTGLQSARELNRELQRYLSEKQILRIDHYLGKETVQNIMVFRFSNGIFEPLWNHKYIDHIQISVCESIGIGSRAGYFDRTGILRDVVQSHLLQVLALLCIEPPIDLSADAIRDEKVKVLRSIRRFKTEDVFKNTVRAAYRKGLVEGKEVCGYREEEGVDDNSQTETFAACELAIDNWRWDGIPIYIRAGKRMPKRITEITVYFKNAPCSMFKTLGCEVIEQNELSIQVQPHEGITLKMSSKPPGPLMAIRPVEMEFSYGESFDVPSPGAYERLLLDAMKGDATLFIRSDEIEEAWEILEPILDAWSGDSPPPLYEYQAGTWGPEESAYLPFRNGHKWRNL